MTSKYRIEVYNTLTKRYILLWEGNTQEMADKMMNKPYNQNITRRLIRATEEILYVKRFNDKRKAHS